MPATPQLGQPIEHHHSSIKSFHPTPPGLVPIADAAGKKTTKAKAKKRSSKKKKAGPDGGLARTAPAPTNYYPVNDDHHSNVRRNEEAEAVVKKEEEEEDLAVRDAVFMDGELKRECEQHVRKLREKLKPVKPTCDCFPNGGTEPILSFSLIRLTQFVPVRQ